MSSATCAGAAERASSEGKINEKRKFGEAFGGDEVEEEDGEEYEEGEVGEEEEGEEEEGEGEEAEPEEKDADYIYDGGKEIQQVKCSPPCPKHSTTAGYSQPAVLRARQALLCGDTDCVAT